LRGREIVFKRPAATRDLEAVPPFTKQEFDFRFRSTLDAQIGFQEIGEVFLSSVPLTEIQNAISGSCVIASGAIHPARLMPQSRPFVTLAGCFLSHARSRPTLP